MRGAWIEIVCSCSRFVPAARRSPCGERGLKCNMLAKPPRGSLPSLPVRGAWIEIVSPWRCWHWCWRRSPCGERGLKLCYYFIRRKGESRRSPCGERGLKCSRRGLQNFCCRSRSPCGERGLKSYVRREAIELVESLPVRGAWIEM